MTLLGRWRELSRDDRRLVVEAAAWFVLIRVALRILPFAPLARWAEGRHRKHTADAAVEPRRFGWATAAVARRLAPPQSCLAQALTAQVMLGARGRPTVIRFGARRDPAEPFRAHAWLECDGKVLVGGEGLDAFHELRDRSRAADSRDPP